MLVGLLMHGKSFKYFPFTPVSRQNGAALIMININPIISE
ncbi:hypothetical protein METSMIF1_02000 [Methanobrevibacter smithii DSM 2374]|uniref:Uncharacterized protein n=1 Tax=Methanobrevibacter smithii DSM 2374 TaxID=521002 RepID=D2ZMF3_METSM|nr:hypothetical protein METSMIF1_02002 [Methanobrevibacter smithii DSM 2374]EFC94196.1 hypothetical protein METSMIF1_02000 [Methanobrevibacter smithii DSM 2374]